MAVSQKEIARQRVKAIISNLIDGTEISKSQFTIVQTKIRGRNAYAVECREPQTLATLQDNAMESYEVEKLSNIVIVIYPEIEEAKK